MSASVVQVAPQGGSVTYAAAPSATVMPGSVVYAEPVGQPISTMTYAAPTMTYAAPQAGSVTYAAPQAGSVTYAAAPSATMMPGSVVYGAPAEPVGQPISTMTYGAPTMTYAAPQAYSAPSAGQPVYTLSPERFQMIMAGQPLTNEEIMAMTGQGAAPVGTQLAGGSASVMMPGSASIMMPQQSQAAASFAMPDMFSSPGITNVYQATEQMPPAASMVAPTASTAIPAASAVVEPTASAPAPAASSDKKKEKKSSKKSSKKKLSSKKKEKGCC